MKEPTYMPLLNSIAVNESKGEILLKAWADATPDAELGAALNFVAIREGEHAWAFTKRMCEMGHPVCEETAIQFFKNFDEIVAFVKSDASDADKVARLSGDRSNDESAPDIFSKFFDDKTIDPVTGGLLGRYIAEERDSGRRLQAEYDRICASAPQANSELRELQACVAELRDEVAELKKIRSVA